MTADLAALIGRTGRLAIVRPNIQVEITVQDARWAFGRTDLLVSPVTGGGSDWVSRSNVTFPEDVPAAVEPKPATPPAWRKSK